MINGENMEKQWINDEEGRRHDMENEHRAKMGMPSLEKEHLKMMKNMGISKKDAKNWPMMPHYSRD